MRVWLFPLLTVGAVSVLAFCQGMVLGLVARADGTAVDALSFPGFLVLVGAIGMWWTVRLTPER